MGKTIICCQDAKWWCRLDQWTHCKVPWICNRHDQVIQGIVKRQLAFRKEDLA